MRRRIKMFSTDNHQRNGFHYCKIRARLCFMLLAADNDLCFLFSEIELLFCVRHEKLIVILFVDAITNKQLKTAMKLSWM